MKQELALFRNEIDAIQSIGLYSIKNQQCLYADENVGTWPFALELCKENLSDNSDFWHLETNGSRFFGHYNGDYLLISQLDATKDINVVILEMKTRQLLSKVIK